MKLRELQEDLDDHIDPKLDDWIARLTKLRKAALAKKLPYGGDDLLTAIDDKLKILERYSSDNVGAVRSSAEQLAAKYPGIVKIHKDRLGVFEPSGNQAYYIFSSYTPEKWESKAIPNITKIAEETKKFKAIKPPEWLAPLGFTAVMRNGRVCFRKIVASYTAGIEAIECRVYDDNRLETHHNVSYGTLNNCVSGVLREQGHMLEFFKTAPTVFSACFFLFHRSIEANPVGDNTVQYILKHGDKSTTVYSNDITSVEDLITTLAQQDRANES